MQVDCRYVHGCIMYILCTGFIKKNSFWNVFKNYCIYSLMKTFFYPAFTAGYSCKL